MVTLGLLFLIMLMGFAAFRLSVDEISIAANQKAAVQAQYIAESGAALMLQWFQEPETFPEIGTFPAGDPAGDPSGFLKRRQADSRGAPSFFDSSGKSQFLGTAEKPDFLYESEQGGPELLGEAFVGLGTITSLKLFGPTTMGAIGTVEATGTTGSGISRTVSVELTPSPIPPTTAAVQIGPGSNGPAPLLVHWGDVKVMGNADLGGSLSSIPEKDPAAPVTGQPYAPSDRRDRWVDFFVGESILNPPTDGCSSCTDPLYGYLHPFQTHGDPGFGLDPWDYEALKAFAKIWGVYYTTDPAGFLYRDGLQDPASRMTPAQALTSVSEGDDRRFVFIDTLDQKPPNGDNLAVIDLPTDYLEGIFSIQAHVVLRESGPGRSIEAQSPSERPDDPSARETVTLSAIHLKGILSVAGRLSVEGHPNVFGALIAQQGFAGSGQPEVWYDADLGTGYHPGLPTVTMLKGSWYIR